jgi:phytoene synthase
VHAIYDGQPTRHAASRWLAEVVSRHSIPRHLCLDLLDGMEMDLCHRPIRDEAELELYCYRVAGSVGMMMSQVLGATGPRATRRARALGIAMQLTNIARDVAEDWDRGRCYLPESWMTRAADFSESLENESVRDAVRRVLDKADDQYAEGRRGLDDLAPGARPGIAAAANLYRAIGDAVRRRNFRVTGPRATVSRACLAKTLAVCWTKRMLSGLQTALGRWGLDRVGPFVFTSQQDSSLAMELTMKRWNTDAAYVVSLGLSLTLTMAVALFIMVGVNPKQDEYAHLPWLYAALSAVAASVTGYLARRLQEPAIADPVPATHPPSQTARR